MPFTFFAAMALGAVANPDPSSPVVSPEVVDAALFKNGYCVVTSQAEVPATGELLLEAPRSAVLGTFWLRATDGKVLSAVNGFIDRTVERDPRDIDEYLSRCRGKVVTVQGPKGDLTGVLENVTKNLVALRTSDGLELLGKGYLGSVRVKGEGKEFRFSETHKVPVLKVSVLRGTKVLVTMMQQGFWWSPAYNMDITDPSQMTLTARSVVVNDLEDVKDLGVRLVTGFPNLPFLGQVDPVHLGTPVSGMLMAGGAFAGRREGQMMQFANRADLAAEGSFAGIDMEGVKGFAAEDLFMYPLAGVTLRQGERMYRQLFQATSGYEHVHTLDAASLTDAQGNRPGNDGRPVDRTHGQVDVWHELKFSNKAGLPLTTGPATVTKGNDVIGQDTLTYTSKDQDARVKISKAMDVAARQTEEEKGRERGFIKDQYNNPRFDRLTVGGKIEVANRKEKPVKLEARKLVYGEVLTCDGGSSVKEPGSLWEVNPASTMKWTVELAPGESKTLAYTYTVLRQPM